MMRPKRITLAPQAVDADGIAQSQTPAAGGVQSLTLNGALVSGGVVTFATPQHVTITATLNETARTFTVTGTDRRGRALTETIAGPNATVAVGAENFATVTGITVDNNTAGAITAGVDGTCEGPWIPLDIYNDYNVSIAGVISAGDTLTFGVQETYDDVFDKNFTEGGATTFAHATLDGETANAVGVLTSPVPAIRAAITAHTSGTLTFNVISGGSS